VPATPSAGRAGAQVSGEAVYSKLKYESGVHRVQRVPQTETQGRVHTSTATARPPPPAPAPARSAAGTASRAEPQPARHRRPAEAHTFTRRKANVPNLPANVREAGRRGGAGRSQ
jgi:hypothetical protein